MSKTLLFYLRYLFRYEGYIFPALPKLSSEENNEKNGLKINGNKVGVQNESNTHNESTKSSSLEDKDQGKMIAMTSFIQDPSLAAAGKQSNSESHNDSTNAKHDTNGTAAMEHLNGDSREEATKNKRNLYKGSFHEQVLINNTNLVTL